MTITQYTFEAENGCCDSFTTMDARKAKERGEKYQMRVIANEYEWSDSETAWDFRPSRPLTQCKKCSCWIDTAYGQDSPAEHQGHSGTKVDPRSPGDHDDICDVCEWSVETP